MLVTDWVELVLLEVALVELLVEVLELVEVSVNVVDVVCVLETVDVELTDAVVEEDEELVLVCVFEIVVLSKRLDVASPLRANRLVVRDFVVTAALKLKYARLPVYRGLTWESVQESQVS